MGALISRILGGLSKMEARIVMVGLDAAGKTSILYKLKLGESVTTIPTIGFNVESVQYNSLDFTIWDIGGQDKIRRLWHHYYANADGIIFVVDSADRHRMEQAQEELHKLTGEPELETAPVLVLANKQDLPDAMKVAEVVEGMALRSLKGRDWYAQGAVAVTGDGLYEGLSWFEKAVKAKKAGRRIGNVA